jgi:hypothetical protein
MDISIIDDQYYHADRGPQLFDFYLQIPGSRSPDAALTPVPLQDCIVYVNQNGLAEIRSRSTGRSMFFHYNSALSLSVRPWVTQFFALFSRPGTSFDFTGFNRHVRALAAESCPKSNASQIMRFPRIILGGDIVIGRSSWLFKPSSLPMIPGSYSPGDIVDCYRDWQLSRCLPDQVFVRSLATPIAIKQVAAKRKDGYKPQYIDFGDPLWVLFFHKYRSRFPGELTMEEALPSPMTTSLPRATQYVVHWST